MATSIEKVEQALPELLKGGGLPPILAMAGPQLMPLVKERLPDDPAMLDDVLAGYAQMMLDLRSDGAPPLVLVRPGGDDAGA